MEGEARHQPDIPTAPPLSPQALVRVLLYRLLCPSFSEAFPGLWTAWIEGTVDTHEGTSPPLCRLALQSASSKGTDEGPASLVLCPLPRGLRRARHMVDVSLFTEQGNY